MNFEKLRKLLIAKAYSLCENKEDAEDLAHDTILYALEKLGTETNEEDFMKLCYRKIKFFYYDKRRKDKVRNRVDLDLERIDYEQI